jgi:hypothetical protein
MNTDLLRQRRNLLIMSGFLIVFNFADIQIVKVSLLGTQLVIGKPSILMLVVWLIWGYFLLRFYQYLNDEKPLGITEKAEEIFNKNLASYAIKKLFFDHVVQNCQHTLIRSGVFHWQCVLAPFDAVKGKHEEVVRKPISVFTVLLIVFLSQVELCFKTTKITDYVLPYIFAVLAPTVSLWSKYA